MVGRPPRCCAAVCDTLFLSNRGQYTPVGRLLTNFQPIEVLHLLPAVCSLLFAEMRFLHRGQSHALAFTGDGKGVSERA